jgi:hypothetical protein
MYEAGACCAVRKPGELHDLRRELLGLLARADMLELHEVGAHVAMALHRLEVAHLGLIHVPLDNCEPS